MKALPRPVADPRAGHLPRWSGEPLALLDEGAALSRESSRLFALSLGLPAVVGFSPAWNRLLLSDLDTFRSRGSFSQVVPYLAGGVILTDAPRHRARRAHLNPPFSAAALTHLRQSVQGVLSESVPAGPFDALAWADEVTLRMLNVAYFSGEFPPALLHAFLAPLRRPFPVPMLPRPVLFARVDAALARLARTRRESGRTHDLLGHLATLPGHVQETRVTLAAAHDTTTHALAWAVWYLARFPQWRTPDGLRPVIRETLRLHPPGFVGSRRLSRDVSFEGHDLPRGALALYSPYLTHRDPDLWPDPHRFDPERFVRSPAASPGSASGAASGGRAPAAWSYLPFGGGERTCLGMHLAHLLLEEALTTLLDGTLRPVWGDPTPRPGVTLGPSGPLMVERV